VNVTLLDNRTNIQLRRKSEEIAWRLRHSDFKARDNRLSGCKFSVGIKFRKALGKKGSPHNVIAA
jgi:hypothetical protein